MNLYRTNDTDNEGAPRARWTSTLAEAKTHMQETPAVFRKAVTVNLIGVPTDRGALLGILNRTEVLDLYIQRTWSGSARGGLLELDTLTGDPLVRLAA